MTSRYFLIYILNLKVVIIIVLDVSRSLIECCFSFSLCTFSSLVGAYGSNVTGLLLELNTKVVSPLAGYWLIVISVILQFETEKGL